MAPKFFYHGTLQNNIPHYNKDLDKTHVMLWLPNFFTTELYKRIIGKWPWNDHFPIILRKSCPFITRFTHIWSFLMGAKHCVIKGLYCIYGQRWSNWKFVFWWPAFLALSSKVWLWLEAGIQLHYRYITVQSPYNTPHYNTDFDINMSCCVF